MVQVFRGVNRLFLLSFENNTDRIGHTKYFFPNVEIKDYNVMIDGRKYFDQPIKHNSRTFEKLCLVKDMITLLITTK